MPVARLALATMIFAALQAASGDSLVRLVPAHREVVEAVNADCEAMMRQMKMAAPDKWTRAVAALRNDLTRMANTDAAALQAMLPEHRARVDAMLGMRRDMMRM